MVLEPEDGRTARRRVAADPFEHRGSELKRMRQDVNLASCHGMNAPSCQIHSVSVSLATKLLEEFFGGERPS